MKNCTNCYFVGECRVFYHKEYWKMDCPAWVKDKEEWMRRNRLCTAYENRVKRRKYRERTDAEWAKGEKE